MESIKNIMEAVNGVEIFKFSYANTDLYRLMQVLREPIAQMGLWWDDPNWEDNKQYWNIYKTTKDKASNADNAMMLHILHGNVLVFPAYECTLYFLNGECVVDRLANRLSKNDVPSGYFGSQSGTAFGRVLAHGYQPMDVDASLFRDWEKRCLESRWNAVRSVNIYANGDFKIDTVEY